MSSKHGKRCSYKPPGYGLQCLNRVYGAEDFCAKHLEWHQDSVLTEEEKAAQRSKPSYSD